MENPLPATSCHCQVRGLEHDGNESSLVSESRKLNNFWFSGKNIGVHGVQTILGALLILIQENRNREN